MTIEVSLIHFLDSAARLTEDLRPETGLFSDGGR